MRFRRYVWVFLAGVLACSGEMLETPIADDSRSIEADGVAANHESEGVQPDDHLVTEDVEPIDHPVTTVTQTVVPLLPDVKQCLLDRSRWGLAVLGPGEPHQPRDDLGVGGDPPGEDSNSLIYFWHLTDSQLVDEESPARLTKGEVFSQSAYRNHESWSPHFLEATIRTGNAFVADRRPFDFAMLTGDIIDNKQKNELEWFMTLMEGGRVDPDSGDDNDPILGENNDQHDPFDAEGLDRQIPWYTVPGNHDELIQGLFNNFAPFLVASSTGECVSALSAAITPTCLDTPFFPRESVLPERCYMPPKWTFWGRTTVPDLNRAHIDLTTWIENHFGTETSPDGHGFTEDNLTEGRAYYAVDDIVPGVPSTLIGLATSANEYVTGRLGDDQLDWLQEQLERTSDEGRIVIVAAHHPLESIRRRDADQLKELLHDHANVVLLVVGHEHRNRVTAYPAPDGSPENGFWQVETSSIIDWPQQTRIIEIVDNRDGTGDIYCTMLDYEVPPDMTQLEGGRFYALYDVHANGTSTSWSGERADRNVILRVDWPTNIEENLEALPEQSVESASF